MQNTASMIFLPFPITGALLIECWFIIFFSSVNPDVTSDQKRHPPPRHHPPAEEAQLEGRSRSLGLTGTIWVLILPCLSILLAL